MNTPISFHSTGYQGNEERVLAIRNRNRPSQETRAYTDWRYLGEYSPTEPLIFWAHHATAGDIGMAGLIPRAYWVDGVKQWFRALGDISVDRDWRGKGVALEMFTFLNSFAASRELGTLLVLPNQRAAPALTKAGWIEAGALHRHVLLLDPSEKLGRMVRPQRLARATGGLYRSGLNWLISKRFSNRARVVESGTLPDSYSTIWERLPKSGRVIRDRSPETLLWRYVHQPGRQYSFLTFTCGGEIAGLAVTHESSAEKSVHVLDFLVNDPGLHASCVAALVMHTISNKRAHTLRFLVNSTSRIRPTLRRFGFLDRDGVTPIQIRQPFSPLLKCPEAWLIRDGDKDA